MRSTYAELREQALLYFNKAFAAERFEDKIKLFQIAIKLRVKAIDNKPMTIEDRRALGVTSDAIGYCYHKLNKVSEAANHYLLAIEYFTQQQKEGSYRLSDDLSLEDCKNILLTYQKLISLYGQHKPLPSFRIKNALSEAYKRLRNNSKEPFSGFFAQMDRHFHSLTPSTSTSGKRKRPHRRDLKTESKHPKIAKTGFSMPSGNDAKALRIRQFIKGLENFLTHPELFEQYNLPKLYDHQQKALESTIQMFKERDICSGYYALPTGSGKTLMMILKLLSVRIPTLIVVPSLTLVNQTIKRIKAVAPDLDVAPFTGYSKRQGKAVTVITYQSLILQYNKDPNKRTLDLDAIGMILFDEAHRSLTETRMKAARFFNEKDKITIGYSATPEFNTARRKNDAHSVHELFGDCLHTASVKELIKAGVLSPYKNIVVSVPEIDPDFLRTSRKRRKNEDYSEEEMAKFINLSKYNQIVIDFYKNGVDPDNVLNLESSFIFRKIYPYNLSRSY